MNDLNFLEIVFWDCAWQQLLHHEFPNADRRRIVASVKCTWSRGGTLAEIADELGLHEFIRTGGDLKEITSKRMQSVRADVLEAVIASIYLDGGLEASQKFIRQILE